MIFVKVRLCLSSSYHPSCLYNCTDTPARHRCPSSHRLAHDTPHSRILCYVTIEKFNVLALMGTTDIAAASTSRSTTCCVILRFTNLFSTSSPYVTQLSDFNCLIPSLPSTECIENHLLNIILCSSIRSWSTFTFIWSTDAVAVQASQSLSWFPPSLSFVYPPSSRSDRTTPTFCHATSIVPRAVRIYPWNVLEF